MRAIVVSIVFCVSGLWVNFGAATLAAEFSDISCQEADDINNCTRSTIDTVRIKNNCEASFTVKAQDLQNWKGSADPLDKDFMRSPSRVDQTEHTVNCCKSLLDDENSYSPSPRWNNNRGVWNAVCRQINTQRNQCLEFNSTKLREKIGDLSAYYGDVAPCVDCQNSKDQVDRLICENTTLRMMENLATKAHIYAYENATKRELDHRRTNCQWLRKEVIHCYDAQCVCRALKRLTNDSLGGESPFDTPN